MSLKVYNSLKKTKEHFRPINKEIVNMYVCGVTVYDFCHIGHARAYVSFDVIKRYLNFLGYKVYHIQNFTDVDDKIIKRANETNQKVNAVTEKFIKAYFDDMSQLNIIKADEYPLVTDNIPEIIVFIDGLVKKNFAYISKNNEVLFSVDAFQNYGNLSKRKMDEQQSGKRVVISDEKKNPHDFILWKPAKENEPSWDSPWGKGRPGWHIECSTLVYKYFNGQTIDIHGGGKDLIFPHHENELAQTHALTGMPLAKYWMHNGFVTTDKEKMSKSLGNFFLIRDILKKYSGPVLRYFFLNAHYRSPIDYTLDNIESAANGYRKICNLFFNIKNYNSDSDKNDVDFEKELFENEIKFKEFMNDDFNTAGALSAIHNMINSFYKFSKNCSISPELADLFYYTVKKLCSVLGIEIVVDSNLVEDDLMNIIITVRKELRKEKNFRLADLIRDELNEINIELRDTPEKTLWLKK